MDKKTFISELRQALSVLQEDELEDIISEYEQHIDMKQKDGLTEEDAIADFGSLSELTAEILEAYHVRADYASNQKNNRSLLLSNQHSGTNDKDKIFRQAQKLCTSAGKSLITGVGSLGRILWSILLFGKKTIIRPFLWLRKCWDNRYAPEEYEESYIEDTDEITPVKTADQIKQGSQDTSRPVSQRSKSSSAIAGALFGKLMGLAARIIGFAGRMIFWGIRMAWNAVCVCFALFCCGCGLFSLYLLGLLTVLLLQRYPLAGLTLGCLGLVLCFFSAAGLGMTFLWRSRKAQKYPGNGPDTTGNAGNEWPEDSNQSPAAQQKIKADNEAEKTKGIFVRPQKDSYGEIGGSQHA